MCSNCPRPGILPKNKDIWRLFTMAQTQLIYTFGGIAGFNYLAFDWVAQKLGITIDARMLDKLRTLEDRFVTLINKSTDKNG